MKCPVSRSLDFVSLSLSAHKTLLPAPPPLIPAAELPMPMYWPPGRALGQNKFAATVMHDGCMIAQQGHDLGVMQPHGAAQVPGIILAEATSSRKVNFSASSVRMGGAPAAVASMGRLCPMSYCSEPCALPLGDVANGSNTVMVGVSAADWLAGAFSIAIGIVASVVASKVGRGVEDPIKKEKIQFFAGQVGALLAGLTAGVFQVVVTGQGTVGVSLGTPPTNVSVGVNFDHYAPTGVSGNVGPAIPTVPSV